MTINLPSDKTELCAARFHAASAAEHLFAAYWSAGRDDDTARYLLTHAHEQFAKLAEVLGYSVTRVSVERGEAAAHRARQMNAELPADQAEVLKLKGMI